MSRVRILRRNYLDLHSILAEQPTIIEAEECKKKEVTT